ncbi:helix-turn-helix domain-containing protein [Nitratireductor thuwali]|uniref:helix-turn-helix domain-containing protein n=1 Tax=Nitratireductor thuwali TaxID=2267699 RepID=UPI0030CDE5DB
MRSILRAQSGVRSEQELHADDPLFVQSIARAMQVLSSFHQAGRPLTLNEIAAAAGIGKSAAQRVVHTLKTLGYIERDADDRGYVPGIRILDHTFHALRNSRKLAKSQKRPGAASMRERV